MVSERLVSTTVLRENVQTNLSDSALEHLIDDADATVVRYCGPHNQDAPVDEILTGGSIRLFPNRAVESVEKTTETVGAISTDLSSNDYRSWYGGRMLERLSDGSHPRPYWGDRVLLRYTPVSTAYVVDDIVYSNGGTYRCITAHTSAAADEPETGASWTTNWVRWPYLNTWAGGVAYIVGDLVSSGSLNYICTTAHTSAAATPPTDSSANWNQWPDLDERLTIDYDNVSVTVT